MILRINYWIVEDYLLFDTFCNNYIFMILINCIILFTYLSLVYFPKNLTLAFTFIATKVRSTFNSYISKNAQLLII